MDFTQILEQIITKTQFLWDFSAPTKVFYVVFLTLIISFIIERSLNKVQDKLAVKSVWHNAFITAIRQPAKYLIWVIGITFAAHLIVPVDNQALYEAVISLRVLGVVTTLTWFILRFISVFEDSLTSENEEFKPKMDKTTAGALIKLLRITVYISAALILMQTLGFSITGILALGGASGVGISLAAKDLLSNFFGALMIYLDKPFKVGDWIRSPDKNIEGTVESIGWRLTKIRTFDKRPLYVPNSVFTTISVENPSRMSHRRIYEVIGVRYNDIDRVDAIVDQIKKMLKEHKEIDDSQTLIVNLDKFNSSSVDFFVYTFTHTTNWVRFHEIKQDVLMKIAQIIEDNGAQMALPTRALVTDPLEFENDNMEEDDEGGSDNDLKAKTEKAREALIVDRALSK